MMLVLRLWIRFNMRSLMISFTATVEGTIPSEVWRRGEDGRFPWYLSILLTRVKRLERHLSDPTEITPLSRDRCSNTVIFEIITFLIQKHFKTVTVTVILRKLIQMTFKTVIGNQWK